MPVRYQVRGRIPDILLPRVTDSPPVPVRGRPREAVALLFPDDRPGWDAYLRALAGHAEAFADWDGRAIAVAPDRHDRWAQLGSDLGEDIWFVRDAHGRLDPGAPQTAAADTVDAGDTALASPPAAAMVDRYGEIYHVWGRSERPDPRELEAWLRFLALQCPE